MKRNSLYLISLIHVWLDILAIKRIQAMILSPDDLTFLMGFVFLAGFDTLNLLAIRYIAIQINTLP